jgi:hypothetical protein
MIKRLARCLRFLILHLIPAYISLEINGAPFNEGV